MTPLLFSLAVLAGLLRPSEPTYCHVMLRDGTHDPGLDLASPSSDKQTCIDGCKLRNPGGCVLFTAEASRKPDGSLACRCIWICMPALKWYQ